MRFCRRRFHRKTSLWKSWRRRALKLFIMLIVVQAQNADINNTLQMDSLLKDKAAKKGRKKLWWKKSLSFFTLICLNKNMEEETKLKKRWRRRLRKSQGRKNTGKEQDGGEGHGQGRGGVVI